MEMTTEDTNKQNRSDVDNLANVKFDEFHIAGNIEKVYEPQNLDDL